MVKDEECTVSPTQGRGGMHHIASPRGSQGTLSKTALPQKNDGAYRRAGQAPPLRYDWERTRCVMTGRSAHLIDFARTLREDAIRALWGAWYDGDGKLSHHAAKRACPLRALPRESTNPGGLPPPGKFARIDTKRLQNAPRDDRIGVPRRISTSVVHRLRHPRRRGRTQAFLARQRRGRAADADLAAPPNQNAQGHGGGSAAGVFPYHRAQRDPYLQD